MDAPKRTCVNLLFGDRGVRKRKDVDELVRNHVPRGENWEREKAKILQFIKANGHQSLDFLNNHFGTPIEDLIGSFAEYNTAVAATGHTCSIAIAALENYIAF
eukprot:13638800-Heterocapsa_arctica.AAC.1